jgi:3-dehydroquinate dehydratase-2
MKILVLNGPNINMLGIREPGIYGSSSFSDLLALIEETATTEHLEIDQYQSNHEGFLVDKIQAAYGVYDGIVINPAAYTHTSIAILDALKAVGLPAVEVHISDVSKREDFRQLSYARLACCKTIMGHGLEGYREAILYLKALLGGTVGNAEGTIEMGVNI